MNYFFALVLTIYLSNTLIAQVHDNSSINLDIQPIWGPIGYDYVEYYYLPDIESYYNVPQNRFYYYEEGHWIGRSYLPSRFSNYNLYKSYKIVVTEREPWKNHKTYSKKYSSYKNRHGQKLIRDSRDPKYFINKNHPENKNWVRQQKHNKGNNNGWDKKNDDNGKKKDSKQKNDRDKNKK
jgi:hypothetical protein